MPSVWRHDPDAVLDYTIDWSQWLGDGETIAASTWDVPAGLTEVDESETTTATSVRVSGGTAGTEPHRDVDRPRRRPDDQAERQRTVTCGTRAHCASCAPPLTRHAAPP
jgi:hypothetical protein